MSAMTLALQAPPSPRVDLPGRLVRHRAVGTPIRLPLMLPRPRSPVGLALVGSLGIALADL